VPTLLVEVAQERETIVTVEATSVAAMLAAETSAREAAMAQDSAALQVKDVEAWASLAEREALERVSRVEGNNVMVLASSREDAEGFVRKIPILEGELTAEH
jgi:hypothetical protein